MSLEVRHGDCLEVMAAMEAGSVDAVVTDPPYGIGFAYVGGKEANSDPDSYWEWLEPRFIGMLRVLRPGGFCAVWQSQLHFQHFWRWFGDGIHIFASCKNFTQIRATPINYAYDPVVMFYKDGDPLRPTERRGGPRDYHIANTAIRRDEFELQHPCPRALNAVRNIVAGFTLPGGIVLDPFAGSGTTGVACAMEGREFIGIEREAEYVEIARRRIEAAAAQTVLPL